MLNITFHKPPFLRRNYKKIRMVMRLTVILITVSMLSVSAKSLSQKVSLSLKNVPLEKVFEQIRQQSGYSFLWNNKTLEQTPNVSVSIHNVSVEEALNACFKALPLSFTINGKVVYIQSKKTARNQAVAETVQNIDQTITGKVLDAAGKPLQGVSVILKGTKRGTMTDAEGRFSLPGTDAGNATLVISYIGYKTREVKLDGRTDIDVVLQIEVNELDNVGVMVSTGYQEIHKERVTGAVSSIDAKTFNTRITTGSILNGLQSRIAGVMINGDVSYKGNNLFQVRGISTMSANASPLIVVDGLPTDLTIDQINPNEVANIYILKDAAAASIYGTRASNGVVVVERIKGKAGKPSVRFISSLSVTPSENHAKSIFPRNNDAYINYLKDENNIYGFGDVEDNANSPYRIPAGSEPFMRYNSGLIDSVQLLGALDSMKHYNNAGDFRKLFEQTALTQQYDLDISGGDEKMNYFVSGNLTSNRLNAKDNSNRTASLSARMNFKFNERVKLELTDDLFSLKSIDRPVPDYNSVFPFEKFYDDNGNEVPLVSMSATNPFYNELQVQDGFLDYMYYPVTEMKEVSTTSKNLNNKISGHLKVNVVKGLDLNLYGIYETNTASVDYYASAKSAAAKSLIDYYTYQNDDGSLGYMVPSGGFATSTTSRLDGYTGRLQADYTTTFSKKHQINIILGTEFRSSITTSNKDASFGYDDETLLQAVPDLAGLFSKDYYYSPFYGEAPYTSAFSTFDALYDKTYTVSRFASVYFNGIYTFDNKYNISLSGRIDRSNLFGTDPRYVNKPLWSAGAAWNVDREKFMKDVQWVDMWKIRISSGFNGNVATNVLPQVIAQYKLLDQVTPNIPSLNITSPANSGLRWEQTYNFNVGTDFSLWHHVNGSLDYYKKISKDLLANGAIDPTKGYNQATVNAGSMVNNGVELTLHADWISTRNFNWNTGIVMSYNKNKVTEIYNSSTSTRSYNYLYATSNALYIKGYSVNPVFAYRYAGLNDAGLPLIYADDARSEKVYMGYDKNYLDVGSALLTYEGNGIPTTNIGISNRFDIGRFYVYAMVDLYAGFKVRVPALTPNTTHPLPGAENYFLNPGDQDHTDVMGFYDYSNMGGLDFYIYDNQDKNVVNGAYLTLRDVTMAYRLGSAFLKRIGFTDFTIKAQATNVLTRGFNTYNYSIATGDFARRNLIPTFTLGIFTNF